MTTWKVPSEPTWEVPETQVEKELSGQGDGLLRIGEKVIPVYDDSTIKEELATVRTNYEEINGLVGEKFGGVDSLRQDIITINEQILNKADKSEFESVGSKLAANEKKTGGLSDPREYGAYGDGVANDTAALQAWLDAPGKNRELRNGVFRITAGLTSSEAGRTIKTDGATILVDSTTDIVALTITGSNSKISVDINGQHKAAIGVSVKASGCEVKKCKIENLLGATQNGIGIRAETSGGVRIEENTILNVSATANGTLGDNAGSARAVLVTSTTAAGALNVVKNNTIAGITGEEGDAIQFLFFDGTFPFLDGQGIIQGNTIKNCNRRAIKVQASNVRVKNNEHFNTLTAGEVPNAAALIDIIQSDDVIVINNSLDARLFIGIQATGTSTYKARRPVFRNNTVRGGTGSKSATFFDNIQEGQIDGNTIYDGFTAISMQNSTGVTISENTIYGGATGNGMNFVVNNSGLVIKSNRAPSGARTYMINNASPDALVQDNYGNLGAGLILTSSTATGSCYKNNVNAGPDLPVIGTSTGQVQEGNINM